MIKDFGGRVASIWETLRPDTKKLIVRAMQSSPTQAQNNQPTRLFYDAHADWELSNLLSAVDEQSGSKEIRSDQTKFNELSLLANTCVRMLEARSASAEIFIQLAVRALRENDYERLDKLSDRLGERYSASEIAEIIRQTETAQIRAIAYESLAMLPVQVIAPLLDDPLYADIAAGALEQQAFEFDSEEARDVLEQFDSETQPADE